MRSSFRQILKWFSSQKFFLGLLFLLLLLLTTLISTYQANQKQRLTEKARAEQKQILETPKTFGQIDVGETAPNQIVGNRVFHPEGVTIDRSATPNRVYVWDSGNNRILAFSSLGKCKAGPNSGQACTNNLDCPDSTCGIDGYKKADIIIGQIDEFHGSCNGDNTQYGPASASTLCSQPYPRAISLLESPEPNQMAVDTNHNLYVFDKWNHRVLKYNDPFTTDRIADFVWGQDNFSDRECNKGNTYSPTRTSLCGNNEVTNIHISGNNKGAGVDVDEQGNVWVADVSNNRVLRFPPNSKEADLVIGQKDFDHRSEVACLRWDPDVINGVHPATDYLCRPKAVRINPHTGQLFVIDWPDPVELSRVLIYNPNPPFSNGMQASEILEGDRYDRYDHAFYRPTGIEIDPFTPDAFWLNDEDNSRVLYFQKQGNNWVATKVLSQPDLEKTGFGGFTCGNYGSWHYSCEAKAGGGIGIDNAGNIYLTDLRRQFVHIFSAPIPAANELNNRGYPADNTILMSQFENSGVVAIDYISGYGLSAPDSAIIADYPNGQKQLLVADHYRILFWNNYDTSIRSRSATLKEYVKQQVFSQDIHLASSTSGIFSVCCLIFLQ